MKNIPSSRLWILVLVVFAVVLDGQIALAQVGVQSINIFPPAPRSLRQNLVRAKKAIEEERFSDAVSELGLILTGANSDQPAGLEDENQDYFLEVAGQPGIQTSIKTEAQRLLGTLPPKGRELFELQFGADARALLDAAVQDADVNQLNEVVRRYFHTTAGYEAALLLGRLHLDHGHPLAAALCLQRVANVPTAASRFEPELSLLLAACWQLARQPARAQATLAALPSELPRGQVRFGDAELRELPRPQDAVAWLTKHFHAVASNDVEIGQWPLFRGSPARNASRSGGLPLKRSRWQVPLGVDDTDRGLIEEARKNFIEQGAPVLPVVQPLAVGNFIVMRTTEQLIGIDFQTGKWVWKYPFWDLPDEEQPNSGLGQQNSREKRLGELRERLWQDNPFGQVSSDGHSVYLLDQMRQTAPQTNRQMRWGGRGRMNFPMELSILQNELVALDLQKEGYTLWKVGGDSGVEEPKLAGAYFLGPPLPLFGNLYIVAELKQELRLVVLDAATGRQQWSQQLAHMEATAGIDEQVRRYAGASPSFADGVLVCPTSAGAIVAVDIATRTLLWGYQYASTRDILGRQSFGQQFPPPTSFPANRWQDASVTIAEGSVIVSPPEADMLVCLDLLTGKLRWELPRTRDLADMLYVAGIYEGNVVVVGKDRMLALQLKDGKLAWKEPAQLQKVDGEMPSGRGFLSDRYYYLPTTESNLLKIDVRSGEIVERSKTEHVLGNLICYRNEIVSVSADRASTFYQIEPLRKQVAEQLAKTPDDAWALARQGELLVHDGKSGEALGVLRKAHERNREDEGVRSLLVDTFLAALEEDFNKHGAMAGEISGLIDNDAQRTRYLMLMASGSQRAGDLPAAAEHYAKLVRLMAQSAKKFSAGDAFTLMSPDKNSTARTDRFVSARLQELYAAGDKQVRDQVDALVAELGAQANAGSLANIRHYLQLCGFHPGADPQRLKLAERLIPNNELLEAELALAPLIRRDDPALGGQALALAAQIYTLGKKPQQLAATYAKLRAGWAEVPVLNGKTGRQLADEAVPLRLDFPIFPVNGQEWPWGLAAVTETREHARQTPYAIHPTFAILERRGDALARLNVEFDFNRSITNLRDPHGTAVVRLPNLEPRAQIESGLWRTSGDGHLLFVAVGNQILATDTLRPRSNENDATLWREPLWNVDSDTAKAMPRERRNPLVQNLLPDYRWTDSSDRPIASVGPMTANGVCFQKIRAITCADPLTGTTLWTRNDFEQGCEMFGDDEFVFVQPPAIVKRRADSEPPAENGAVRIHECSVLSATDGRLLGKRRLPLPAQQWTTRGRNVLAWEQQDGQIRVFLYDVQQQADVWSESFAIGSRGDLIDNESVAVLEPNGRLIVRSLSASEKLETKIEATRGLIGIQVLPSSQRLLVIVNDNQPSSPEVETNRRAIPQVLQPVNGRIFAIDRQSGEHLWPVPAVVRGYAMLPNQPEEIPALWFIRSRSTSTTQFGPSANAKVDVLCLDRRTGSALVERSDVASLANSFEIVSDARKYETTLSLPQAQFTVRFTSDPRPPAPPFQQFREGMRLDAAVEKLMKSFFDALVPVPKVDPFN